MSVNQANKQCLEDMQTAALIMHKIEATICPHSCLYHPFSATLLPADSMFVYGDMELAKKKTTRTHQKEFSM